MRSALILVTALTLVQSSAIAGISCDGPFTSKDGQVVAMVTNEGNFEINGTIYKMRACGTGYYCSYDEVGGVKTPTKSMFLNFGTIPPEVYYQDPVRGEIILFGSCTEEATEQ